MPALDLPARSIAPPPARKAPAARIGIPPLSAAQRMYAVAFDVDTETLSKAYPSPAWNNAYADIRRILERHGFAWQQGSVYFGGEQVNAVTCVLAVIDCTQNLSWFAASVRDIRMLRIEEFNDLMPAVRQALGEPE